MILFLLAASAGVLLGLRRGGTLSQLQFAPLRMSWLVPPTVAVQMALIFASPVSPAAGTDPLRWCLPATMVMLALFVAANHRQPGLRLVLAGLLLNLAVVAANGGLMPTNEAAIVRAGLVTDAAVAHAQVGMRLPRSKDVVLPLAETRLWVLSDTLVGPPLPRPKVMSIGDLMIALGLIAAVSGAMRRPLAPRRHRGRAHRNQVSEIGDVTRVVEAVRQARLAHLRGARVALARPHVSARSPTRLPGRLPD